MSDRFSVEGRVACVTGASSGLGRAIATALADAGLPRLLAQRKPKRGRRRRNGRREPAIPNRTPIHQRPTRLVRGVLQTSLKSTLR